MNVPLVIVLAVLAAACSSHDHGFQLPTAATPPATGTAPSPLPAPQPPVFPPNIETTSIAIGETFVRTIGDSPSECFDFRGWPCQYFEFTAPRSGTIVVQLTFVPGTQPGGQGIDISMRGEGERWAQFYDHSSARLTSPVTAGVSYTITLWYTFPRLEYTLRTAYSD
jgi:hypothetical protein